MAKAPDEPTVDENVTDEQVTAPEVQPAEEAPVAPDEQLEPDTAEPAEEQKPAVEADDLEVTNQGVDLTASDLPEKENEDNVPENATAATEAVAAADPTPAQEAATQVSNGPGQIDGSGITTKTNQDVIDNFPKNEQGQVVIGEDGKIVGLPDDQQPSGNR